MIPIILHADHLVSMDERNSVIPNGAVLIGADGRIQAVGEADAILAANPGIGVKRLANRLLIPGLINTHAHSGLLRGTAEGLPVWEWLQQFIDPMHRVVNAKDRFLDTDFRVGVSLTRLERLRRPPLLGARRSAGRAL